MRAFCVVAAFSAAFIVPRGAAATDTWSDPFPGVRRLHRETSSQNINVLVVDLCAGGVSVRATGSGERQRTVSSFGALVGAQAAINGDFFNYSTYSTSGPARSDGAAWGGSDSSYIAPVQFGANQVALPANNGPSGVASWAREVVSGHPSLIVAGQRRSFTEELCTARHPRTALGLGPDRSKLYLAVVDGRATGRIGMTCGELGELMAGLGAVDAVNLDGGGSSTMWLQGPGVINYPSEGSQRVVANHLAIRATGSGAAPSCPIRTYDATFAAMDAPTEMTSGDEAVVWLELVNAGNVAWDLDATRVGTQDPEDRASPFYKEGNWIAPSRPTAADHSDYGPGAVGRFTWAMLAPEVTESTRFDETFELVQEGVRWFGPPQVMSIVVHPRSGPTDPDPDGDDGGGGCSAGGQGAGVVWLLAIAALVAATARRRPPPRRIS